MVIVLVVGPCGPSSFNPANAECVAIGERSKNVYSRLVYCKIRDDIAVDSESQLLLTRAGGSLLLGITNPRSTFFMCPRHRYLFGTRWCCNNSRCLIPTEVAARKGKSSAPEAQYGLKRAYSAHDMSATNMLVQVCSCICLNGFLEKKILCLRDQCASNFNTLGCSFSAQV